MPWVRYPLEGTGVRDTGEEHQGAKIFLAMDVEDVGSGLES